MRPWSADGKYLYFDDLVTDEESICRVELGSRRTERVLKLEGIERYPGPFGLWSGRMADGSFMFVRDRSSQEVYQLTVALPRTEPSRPRSGTAQHSLGNNLLHPS